MLTALNMLLVFHDVHRYAIQVLVVISNPFDHLSLQRNEVRSEALLLLSLTSIWQTTLCLC